MKQSKWLLSTVGCSLVLLCACSTQERVRTYEVSEVSNDAIENRMVEEYVGPDKKRVVNRQFTREKVRCVDQNGRRIHANTVMECMKRKGRIVDEVFQEEKVTRSR
jgi:hypothetical protein